MRRPLGLTLIVIFYMIIGGLMLSLSFLNLLTMTNNTMKFFYLDYCYEIISKNTILTRAFLESLPQNTAILVTFLATFLTSIFYTKLAETLLLGKAVAYLIGTLLHLYAAISSLGFWVIGIDKVKFVGILFLFINLLKVVYLYLNKNHINAKNTSISPAP
jgi:hypothetical protein